jgi:hypothetical protein
VEGVGVGLVELLAIKKEPDAFRILGPDIEGVFVDLFERLDDTVN